MKKLLLSLFCLLTVCVSAFAADVTISLSGSWDPALPAEAATSETTHTCGDYTITIYNGKVHQSAILLTKGSGYLQLPAFEQKVEKITFYSQDGASKTAVVKIYEGSTSVEVGSATTADPSVDNGYTITIPEDKQKANVAYRFKPTSSKNAQISKVELTFAGASTPAAVATPTFSVAGGGFSEAFNLTISCATEGATIYYTTDGNAPTASSTEYTGAINISETTTVKAIAVKGDDTSNVASATYVNINCSNISEWLEKAAADRSIAYIITNPVTVVYNALSTVSGEKQYRYTYVQDATGSLLIYNIENSLTPGQTLTGLAGEYTMYSGLKEMVNANIADLTPDSGEAPAPATMAVGSITTDNQNKYVKLAGVAFNPTTKKASQDGAEIDIFYRFAGVEAPAAAGKYDIEGFVSVYNEKLQVYPTSFKKLLEDPVIAVTTKDDATIANEGMVDVSEAPVTITVTNPNDAAISIYLMKGEDYSEVVANVDEYTEETWTYTITEAGHYGVMASIFTEDGQEASANFVFTIDGPESLMNPIVSLTDSNDNLLEDGASAKAPVKFSIDNYAYNNSKIYYYVTKEETTPEYTVSEENFTLTISEPGDYRYNAYVASYEGEKLTGISDEVSGTFTVLPAGPKDPVIVMTDKDGAEVASGATLAEDKAPVTVTITNPNEGVTMYISTMNLDSGESHDYQAVESHTLTIADSGQWAVGVFMYDDNGECYKEVNFTIEGEIKYLLVKPAVEFLNSDDYEVESPANERVTMIISHQNYNEGALLVYTINGEETTTEERFVEIPITEAGVITYSAYVKLGTKSLSDVEEGEFEVLASAFKLVAPTITFTTPENESTPVTCTITNTNYGGYGTIVYAIGTSEWYEGEGGVVTFDLPNDGNYTVKAYVRNDEDETLNSEVTEEEYVLSGINGIFFGEEGVSVRGGEIVAPEGAEIYNLSGIRMANGHVAPGIYIVRVAGKAVKVTVK